MQRVVCNMPQTTPYTLHVIFSGMQATVVNIIKKNITKENIVY